MVLQLPGFLKSSIFSKASLACLPCYLARLFILGSFFLLIFYLGTQLSLHLPPSGFLSPPSPTPTPDTRASLNQTVQIDHLQLTVTQSLRILRPHQDSDLGIITVKFTAVSPCGETPTDPRCIFHTSRFRLSGPGGGKLASTTPPTKFIRGLTIRPLVSSRFLHPLITETGQLYFLLPSNQNDFTLIYTSPITTNSARFRLAPQTYSRQKTAPPTGK